MGRIGSLPSVPEELLADVQATSWWLGDTWPGVSPESGEGDEACARTLARRPVTLRPDAALTRVARELEDTSLVVVVDEMERPLGVLTPAHVLRAVGRLSRDELANAKALDATTSGGAFIPESCSLAVAARMLADDDRAFGVVVDADGRLVGTLSASSLLRALEGQGAQGLGSGSARASLKSSSRSNR